MLCYPGMCTCSTSKYMWYLYYGTCITVPGVQVHTHYDTQPVSRSKLHDFYGIIIITQFFVNPCHRLIIHSIVHARTNGITLLFGATKETVLNHHPVFLSSLLRRTWCKVAQASPPPSSKNWIMVVRSLKSKRQCSWQHDIVCHCHGPFRHIDDRVPPTRWHINQFTGLLQHFHHPQFFGSVF